MMNRMNQGAKQVVTMPLTVYRRAVKRKQKLELKQLEQMGSKFFDGHRHLPPVIKCRRPELNHYRNQVYDPAKGVPMATQHWPSRSTIGDFFTLLPYRMSGSSSATDWNETRLFGMQQRGETLDPAVFQHLQQPSFSFYGLDKTLVNRLSALGFHRPTNIQDLSIPHFLTGDSGIIASETGNGKTLAFLVPVIQKCLRTKASFTESQQNLLNAPMAVIVTPGRELATQIYHVAKDLCLDQSLDLSVRLEHGSHIKRKMLHGDRKLTDILIGSIGGVRKLFFSGFLRRDKIHTIVMDEADSLVDDTFLADSSGLVGMLLSHKDKISLDMQLMFASATFPRNISHMLQQHLDLDDDGLPVLQTHQLHRVPNHIIQKFIRAPKTGRVTYLLDLLEQDLSKKHPVIVFSNKGTTAAFVHHFLKARGIDCGLFCGIMPLDSRSASLADFFAGRTHVLSCTDLISRGVDTTNVRHVINYDFPSNISDYLHRVGRVGRVGSKASGKVTSLVCGQVSIGVVQAIEAAVRAHQQLNHVNSNIAQVINQRYLLDSDDDETA